MDHAPASAPHIAAPPRERLIAVDLARAAALLAMALYHFVFDLEMFGLVPPGTALLPGWRWLAYLTAGSFLFLAGVSLWLAHGAGIRWRGFWRRFARVVGAALLITVATYLAIPDAFIFFGILHAIALGSLVGLAALRLPAVVLVGLGVAVLLLPQVTRVAALSDPVWWWLGLQAVPVRAVDYVPLFPWLAPVLWGVAAAKAMARFGGWAWLAKVRLPAWARPLSWPGRHSLTVYLLHQPVLIGALWLVTRF